MVAGDNADQGQRRQDVRVSRDGYIAGNDLTIHHHYLTGSRQAGAERKDSGPLPASNNPEFGRLLLPYFAPLREIRDPNSGKMVAFHGDASILFYLIEHFVRLGVVDIAVDAHSFANAIPALPDAFRQRIIEVGHADSVPATLQICEPIATELGIEVQGIGVLVPSNARNSSALALGNLADGLEEFIRGMRLGTLVTLNFPVMRRSVNTLLWRSKSPGARASLVTVEQVLSSYRPCRIGAVTMRSTAAPRMIELFNELISNPLYRDLSHHVPAMGIAGESAAAVVAVTNAANRLADRDSMLTFDQYKAFIPAEGLQVAVNKAETSDQFRSEYLPLLCQLKEPSPRRRLDGIGNLPNSFLSGTPRVKYFKCRETISRINQICTVMTNRSPTNPRRRDSYLQRVASACSRGPTGAAPPSP